MTRDEELIQRCAENDRKAQEELFRRYASRMYGVCLRYSSGAADAQDLLHDGFLKVFEKIGNFRGESSLETWITRVFMNLAISRFRSNRSRPEHTAFDEEWHDTPDESPETEETNPFEGLTSEMVVVKMQELPEKYRVVMNLYAVEKLSHREIADALGISEGTSKSQLSRARVMLKNLLMDTRRKG